MTYSEILDLINSNLASGTEIKAVKHREVETALLDFIQSNVAQQYDIKAIYANTTYLGANFESNGLGKNLRAGWAICNGNNGTPNISNRVIVQYGSDFPTLNAVGGSKDAIVVAHSHSIGTSPNDAFGYVTAKASASNGGTPINTNSVGESGLNKNMQPYIVLVYIMKL